MAATSSAAARGPREGFPVTKVVLAKNGVGYFERSGEVTGSANVELFFKTADMNDVLKSLTMVDQGAGGLVSSISYESTKPVDEQLHELSLQLDPLNGNIAELLIQLKGTDLEVEVDESGEAGADEKKIRTTVCRGPLIGLESTAPGPLLFSMLVDGAVRVFKWINIRRLTLKSELVQFELKHLLRILLQAKKKDMKSVTAYTEGTGLRTIQASYIVEAPVWKTSYRLLLGAEGKSMFQGWALVDNTSAEDWRGVELSLVSGIANSFVYDLYNPRFVKRSEVHVVEEHSEAPPVLEDAVAVHDLDSLDKAEVKNIAAVASKPHRIRSEEKMEKEMDRPAARPASASAASARAPSAFLSSASASAAASPFGYPASAASPVALAPAAAAAIHDFAFFAAAPAPAPASVSVSAASSPYGYGGGGAGASAGMSYGAKGALWDDNPFSSSSDMRTTSGSIHTPLRVHSLTSDSDLDLLSSPGDETSRPSADLFTSFITPATAPTPLTPYVAPAATSLVSEAKLKMQTKNMDSNFTFKIPTPVTIQRNQAALVPFLQDRFEGKKLAIYNKNVRTNNPLNVIEFPNTYGAPLESGPLSIYENNVFVGEAMLPTMTASKDADNKVYVAYSVELKCDITQEHKDKLRRPFHVAFSYQTHFLTPLEELQRPVPRRRRYEAINISRYRVYSTHYIIDNKGDDKIDLIIEHPRRMECELTETTNLMKTSDHFYRFNIDAPAKRVITFEVRERVAAHETYQLRDITEQQVRSWYTQNWVDETCYLRLHELAWLNAQRALLQRRCNEAEQFYSTMMSEQSRCDNCISTLLKMEGALDRQDRRLQSEIKHDVDNLEATHKRREWEDKEYQERRVTLMRERDEEAKRLEAEIVAAAAAAAGAADPLADLLNTRTTPASASASASAAAPKKKAPPTLPPPPPSPSPSPSPSSSSARSAVASPERRSPADSPTGQLIDLERTIVHRQRERVEQDRQRVLTEENRASRRKQLLDFQSRLPTQLTDIRKERADWVAEVARAFNFREVENAKLTVNLDAQHVAIDEILTTHPRAADLAVAPELPERDPGRSAIGAPVNRAFETDNVPAAVLAIVAAARAAREAAAAAAAAAAEATAAAAKAAATLSSSSSSSSSSGPTITTYAPITLF